MYHVTSYKTCGIVNQSAGWSLKDRSIAETHAQRQIGSSKDFRRSALKWFTKMEIRTSVNHDGK